jgi:hypothetical protein
MRSGPKWPRASSIFWVRKIEAARGHFGPLRMDAGRLRPRCRPPCRSHVEIVGSPQKTAGRAGPSLAHGAKKGRGRGGGDLSPAAPAAARTGLAWFQWGKRARPVPAPRTRRCDWRAGRRGGEVSPCCAMGFACGREVAGGGERQGRRRPSSFRLSRSAADPVAAGPDVRARVHVRVAGEAEGREGTWWAGRRAGTGGVVGGRESRSHSRPLRVGGSSQSARAPCVGPRPQYQPVQRERGRRVAARARWNVYGCRGSLRVELGNRCEVLRRARWSLRGAATGRALLEVFSASRTRVRVRELATRACGVSARQESSTRVEGEGPKVWGRARRRRSARLGARVDTGWG